MVTIDGSSFTQACNSFFNASNYLHDGWSLKKLCFYRFPVLEKKFIYKKEKIIKDKVALIKSKETIKKDIIKFSDGEISDFDENFSGEIQNGEFFTIQCQVFYSEAYSNPVLYFQPCNLSGEMLTLEECWNLTDSYQKYFNNKRLNWSFISQTMHPVLKYPLYQLHPCHTADFMEPINKSTNYVMSWLSICLLALGLDFKPELYELFFKQNINK